MSYVEMTDNNFMDLINKSDNLIIDVWAEWCKPCKLLDPIFEDLAKNHGNSKIIFAKLDGNTYRNAAKALKVMSFPTFVIFKNGKLTRKWSGADVNRMRREIEVTVKN